MNFKKDVVYYFDEMIGTYHYAFAHPMKPLRVAMTDEIVKKYNIDQHFETIVRVDLFRIFSLRISISTMPPRRNSQLFTPMSTSISSAMSPLKTGPTSRISSIASTSRKIVQSWRGSTITASATPADPLVLVALFSHCCPAEGGKVYIRDQLVGRAASRQAILGLRVLLYQRLRACHFGATQDLPESALYRYRYPPRRWC